MNKYITREELNEVIGEVRKDIARISAMLLLPTLDRAEVLLDYLAEHEDVIPRKNVNEMAEKAVAIGRKGKSLAKHFHEEG